MFRAFTKIFPFAFALLCYSHGGAQDFQKTGTSGFVFLEIPVSARYLGMGETGLTLSNAHADGLFINPALISLGSSTFSVLASYSEWYVETTHQALGLTYRLPTVGTLGFQLVYFDFGEIQKTRNPFASRNEFGSYIELGTYTAGGLVAGVSYARQLTDKFSFGSSVKYVRETIDIEAATNVILDIGFYYDTGFRALFYQGTGIRSLRLGAFLKDFGLESKYVNEKFKMPQQLKFGISSDLIGDLSSPNRLTILAEAVHPNDANERIHLGIETILLNSLILRAGYKLNYDEENLTLGAGLRFQYNQKSAAFDFSYMNHDYLDTTVRYTLSLEL